jgi:ATP-binding protein involved in chromosome partitioning
MFGSRRSPVDESAVLAALRKVVDPDLGRDIVSLGFIKDLRIDGGNVSFKVELTTPACPVKEKLRSECVEAVRSIPGVESTTVEMTASVRRAGSESSVLGDVLNIVAVASGKGGVGKSTVAINLALALKDSGASVGLLDADVYGPSMAMMFGLEGGPGMTAAKRFVPMEGHGVKVMSMGVLLDPDRPVIWRGPMVHNLLQQFVGQVEWGPLDYLVIDLPPGTGDAQLSISQIVSISGAVIVTTPQDISLLDARKGLQTFRQLKVPVLGIVENMSYFICPHCNERTEIFRHGGGRRASEELGVPFLGEIPIDPKVAVSGDEGKPILLSAPDSAVAVAYRALAGQVAAALSKLSAEGIPAHVPIMPGPIQWK